VAWARPQLRCELRFFNGQVTPEQEPLKKKPEGSQNKKQPKNAGWSKKER
jgi:hypothetical protein